MIVGVMTCDRPGGVSYLDKTIASLKAACFESPIFGLVDGDKRGCFRAFAPRLGIVPTFLQLVAGMLARSDGDPLVVFQDDIDVQPSLKEIIDYELPSPPGIWSLYLSADREAPRGWSPLVDDGSYPLNVGACGLVLARSTAERLMTHGPFPRTDRLGSQLVKWCWNSRIPFYVHSPSLIKHIGEVRCR